MTGINVPMNQPPKVPPMQRAVEMSHKPQQPRGSLVSLSLSCPFVFGSWGPRSAADFMNFMLGAGIGGDNIGVTGAVGVGGGRDSMSSSALVSSW